MNKKGELFDFIYVMPLFMAFVFSILIIIFFMAISTEAGWFDEDGKIVDSKIGNINNIKVSVGGFGHSNDYTLTFKDGTKIITKDIIERNNVVVTCRKVKIDKFLRYFDGWRCEEANQ